METPKCTNDFERNGKLIMAFFFFLLSGTIVKTLNKLSYIILMLTLWGSTTVLELADKKLRLKKS